MRQWVVDNLPLTDPFDGRFANLTPVDGNGGRGVFSVVFVATDLHTGEQVILKCYDPSQMSETYRFLAFQRECRALEDLSGRNLQNVMTLASPLRTCEIPIPLPGGQSLPLQLHYVGLERFDQSLHDRIYSSAPFELADKLKFFRQIVLGLFRIHRAGYCHRDLKPDNVLLRGNYLVVSDFGSAKQIAVGDSHTAYQAGHRDYVSPEIAAGVVTTETLFSADIFALGLILYELLHAKQFVWTWRPWRNLITLLVQVKATPASFEQRREKLEQILTVFAGAAPPPTLFSPGAHVAPGVRFHLERLFSSLIAFDYRRRARRFEMMLLSIDRALRVEASS